VVKPVVEEPRKPQIEDVAYDEPHVKPVVEEPRKPQIEDVAYDEPHVKPVVEEPRKPQSQEVAYEEHQAQPNPQIEGIAYDEFGRKIYVPATYDEARVQGAAVQSYDYSERDAQRAMLMNEGKPAPTQFGVNAYTVLKGA
jgi:hypothetical protein